jgi:hypothetical protein
MNRSHLRGLPAPSTPQTPADPAAVSRDERELLFHFEGLLALGRSDDEAPDFELLEAAVDGKLGEIEAGLFASRLAGDAALQREFDELVALRDRLALRPASRPEPRSVPSRRWMALAAAAALLAVVGLELRQHPGPNGEPDGLSTAGTQLASSTSDPAQPLFADSFEGGSTERWSN